MNKYLQQPQATYDFHGLRSWEVEKHLQTSIDEAKRQKYTLVHLIVGKGNNSEGAPVVRTMVQEALMHWGYAYRFAKRHEGGEGVLVVHI
jgi:DNA-nicking Smr family endonuclease